MPKDPCGKEQTIEEVVATDIAASVYMEIEETPTAFDKEKVMGDMYLIGRKYCENVSCEEECDDCDHGVLMNSLIKIVEKGGIE